METIEERAAHLAKEFGATKANKESAIYRACIRMAKEQKDIDDAERKSLIEKVIWLIEDSYPDTVMWTHDELVENVTKDLESRARELNEMFD